MGLIDTNMMGLNSHTFSIEKKYEMYALKMPWFGLKTHSTHKP